MFDLRPHCDQLVGWPDRRADSDITNYRRFNRDWVPNRESRQGHDLGPAGIALLPSSFRCSGHIRIPLTRPADCSLAAGPVQRLDASDVMSGMVEDVGRNVSVVEDVGSGG
jgi:hypothetical protein